MASDEAAMNGAGPDGSLAELSVDDLFATIGRLEVGRQALVGRLAELETELAGLRALATAQQQRLRELEPDAAAHEPQPS